MVTDSAKIFVLLLLALFFSGRAAVSFDVPKPYSKTLADTADTRLGKEVCRWVAAHDGLSGTFPTMDSRCSETAGLECICTGAPACGVHRPGRQR